MGIYLNKKVGETVKAGETIATVYGNDDAKMAEGLKRLEGAYAFSDTPVNANKLIKGIVD